MNIFEGTLHFCGDFSGFEVYFDADGSYLHLSKITVLKNQINIKK